MSKVVRFPMRIISRIAPDDHRLCSTGWPRRQEKIKLPYAR